MAHDILLEFLKLGLIDVEGNDDRLAKLQQTATDVSAIIKKNWAKTVPFTLAAVDPNLPETDPVVTEVLGVLRLKWPTYPNAFSGIPVTIVRAILLDALVSAAGDDDNIAVAFACLARNIMPFIQTGNEQAVWTMAVSRIEQLVDERAAAEWTTPATIAAGDFSFSTKEAEIKGKLTKKVVNEEHLRRQIQGAFQQAQNGGQNPYNPHQNPVQWTQQASILLSKAIAETLDAVVDAIELKGGDISGPFKAFSDAASNYVESALQNVAVAAGGLDRRTNLLWWREALYSPSARLSYRDLPITTAAALMAFDLSNQIPIYSPASAAAFLREAVSSLLTSPDETYTLRTLLDEIRTSVDLVPVRTAAAGLVPQLLGRGPLLAVIAQSGTALPEAPKFVELVGVSYDAKLKITEWARWIYNELQALKAVEKRKSRKS